MTDGPKLEVSGGFDGVQAKYEDLYAMAHLSEQTSGDLLSMSAQYHAMLIDPDVVASAVLDPKGAVEFEAALIGALDGSDGLTHVAGGVGVRALQLRAAAVKYQASEAANEVLFKLDNFFDTAKLAADLPGALGDTIEAALGGGSIKGVWQNLLSEHPGFTDVVAGDLPVLLWLASHGHIPPTATGIAQMLGRLYPDGHPDVAEIPFVDKDGVAARRRATWLSSSRRLTRATTRSKTRSTCGCWMSCAAGSYTAATSWTSLA